MFVTQRVLQLAKRSIVHVRRNYSCSCLEKPIDQYTTDSTRSAGDDRRLSL
jgi:hypothetical protein